MEELEEAQKEEARKRAAEKKAKKQTDTPDDESSSDQNESTTRDSGADTSSPEVNAGSDTNKEAQSEKASAKPQKKAEEETGRKKKTPGKNIKNARSQVDKDKIYTIDEAIATLKKISFVKFDPSIEVHINATEKGLRGEVELPHSTGRTVRVQIVDDAVLDEIEKGNLTFDVLVAHPSYMPKLAKFARTLGPKGLMPNPKNGTISPNPEEVVKKFQKGTLQWKGESKHPLIHQMVAKMSSSDAEIKENIVTFLQSVGKANIQAVFIGASMSPSLKVDAEEVL